MPLAEAADIAGVEPRIAVDVDQAAAEGHGIAESARVAVDEAVCADAAVVDHPVVDAELARHHRRAAGQARGVGRVEVGEAHALAGHAVDGRGRGAGEAVASQMIGPQRVEIKIEDFHIVSSSLANDTSLFTNEIPESSWTG